MNSNSFFGFFFISGAEHFSFKITLDNEIHMLFGTRTEVTPLFQIQKCNKKL